MRARLPESDLRFVQKGWLGGHANLWDWLELMQLQEVYPLLSLRLQTSPGFAQLYRLSGSMV